MDKLEKEIRNKKSELEDNPMLKIVFFFFLNSSKKFPQTQQD